MDQQPYRPPTYPTFVGMGKKTSIKRAAFLGWADTGLMKPTISTNIVSELQVQKLFLDPGKKRLTLQVERK